MAEIAEKVKIEIAPELTQELKNENQVIVHCMFPAKMDEYYLRIWPTTYLVCKHTQSRAKIIHQENISLVPNWTKVNPSENFFFTLIFEGLPKSCRSFDMIEEIPQSGGFAVRNMIRNNADVYRVVID